jgi:hypothetical protein
MTDDERIPAGHRTLIVAQAARRGMTEWSGAPRTLIAVGDAETFYELVHEGNQIAYVETQRGHGVVQALFTTVADAVRYLVFVLSDRLPVPSPGWAPRSAYAADGEDWILRWPGGQAISPRGRLPVETAREFSWVATADPVHIALRRVPILRVASPPDGSSQ